MTQTQKLANALKDGPFSSSNSVKPPENKEKPVKKPRKDKPATEPQKPAAEGHVEIIATPEPVQSVPIHAPTDSAPKGVDNSCKPTVPLAETHNTPTLIAKKPSLLNDILAAGDDLAGSQVVEAIEMANTILTNAGAVSAFTDALDAAEALAIQKDGFDKVSEDVRRKWRNLNLPEIEKQLQAWANAGDLPAKKILATLTAFKKSTVDVISPLWQLVTEIIRPAMDARGWADLSVLIRTLFDKGLLEKKVNQPRWPKEAVVLGSGFRNAVYLPLMVRHKAIPMAQAAWPWIKEAERRAQDQTDSRMQRMQDIRNEATGLTPQDAKLGKEGSIFLNIGRGGALLLLRTNGTGLSIRVSRVIGIGPNAETTGWIKFDAGQDSWSPGNKEIFGALNAWKKS